MNTPREIRAKAQRIEHEAKAFLVESDTADAARKADLLTQFDRAIDEADGLYTRADKLEAIETRSAAFDVADPRRPVETRDVSSENVNERAASAFETYLRGAATQGDLAILRSQSVGTPSEGGYMVPTLLANELIKPKKNIGPMLDPSLVHFVNTDGSGAPMNWPVFDNTANKATRIAENAQAGTESFVFATKPLNVYKYKAGPFLIPTELLQDSVVNITETVLNGIAEMFERGVNEALTIGDGSGDPWGLMTSASAGVTAAAVAAITADELHDLMYSVDEAYHPAATWQFNQKTLNSIRKLKDGQGRYIWTAGDIVGGAPNTILNVPYRVNSAIADLAAGAKTVAFGDHSAYYVRQITGVAVKRLVERYADYDQTGFVAFARYGGNLMDVNAVKVITQAAS